MHTHNFSESTFLPSTFIKINKCKNKIKLLLPKSSPSSSFSLFYSIFLLEETNNHQHQKANHPCLFFFLQFSPAHHHPSSFNPHATFLQNLPHTYKLSERVLQSQTLNRDKSKIHNIHENVCLHTYIYLCTVHIEE